jgi:hypothetical protein
MDNAPAGYLDDLRTLNVDLHLHTVVSACAQVEMVPPLIVRQALALGLDAIAVTDHNTAENVAAVIQAAEGAGLQVLPGMETQTREEAHILCLFDTVEQALAWQDIVYRHLPALLNNEDLFGPQFVVDEMGDLMRTNERLLLISTSLSVEQVVEQVGEIGGVTIAAHVDRPAYSLLTSLGFIPPELGLAALEVTARTPIDSFLAQNPTLRGWPLVRSSDAHRLSEMGNSTQVRVRELTVAELAKAFRGQGGRGVSLLS